MRRPEMTTGQFWIDTLERAIKTMAQVVVATVGTGAVGITSLDWAQIGSLAATAGVVSIMMSLASDRIGNPGPSLVAPPPLPEPYAEETEEAVELTPFRNAKPGAVSKDPRSMPVTFVEVDPYTLKPVKIRPEDETQVESENPKPVGED